MSVATSQPAAATNDLPSPAQFPDPMPASYADNFIGAGAGTISHLARCGALDGKLKKWQNNWYTLWSQETLTKVRAALANVFSLIEDGQLSIGDGPCWVILRAARPIRRKTKKRRRAEPPKYTLVDLRGGEFAERGMIFTRAAALKKYKSIPPKRLRNAILNGTISSIRIYGPGAGATALFERDLVEFMANDKPTRHVDADEYQLFSELREFLGVGLAQCHELNQCVAEWVSRGSLPAKPVRHENRLGQRRDLVRYHAETAKKLWNQDLTDHAKKAKSLLPRVGATTTKSDIQAALVLNGMQDRLRRVLLLAGITTRAGVCTRKYAGPVPTRKLSKGNLAKRKAAKKWLATTLSKRGPGLGRAFIAEGKQKGLLNMRGAAKQLKCQRLSVFVSGAPGAPPTRYAIWGLPGQAMPSINDAKAIIHKFLAAHEAQSRKESNPKQSETDFDAKKGAGAATTGTMAEKTGATRQQAEAANGSTPTSKIDRQDQKMTTEEIAIAFFLRDTNQSIREIARQAGCSHVFLLKKCPNFMSLRETYAGSIPKGQKMKDGTVEAEEDDPDEE
jgi:hypothetical protein